MTAGDDIRFGITMAARRWCEQSGLQPSSGGKFSARGHDGEDLRDADPDARDAAQQGAFRIGRLGAVPSVEPHSGETFVPGLDLDHATAVQTIVPRSCPWPIPPTLGPWMEGVPGNRHP